MAAGPELRSYVTNLNQAKANVDEIKDVIGHIDDAIDLAQMAIKAVDTVEKRADEFGKTLSNLKLSLKLMDKTGPLKALAKVGLDIVGRLEKVARQIEDKAHDLAQKIDDKKFEQKLDDAEKKLEDYDKKLEEVGHHLELRAFAAQASVIALDTVDALDPNGDPAALLAVAADRRVAASNLQIGVLNDVYQGVRNAVGVTGQAVPEDPFQAIVDVRIQFDKIAASIDFLKGPLNVVASVLKPIEPLLNVVGFVFDITVGPVINYLTESLGINRIIDSAAARIAALLPSPAALDHVLADFDVAIAELGPLGELADKLGVSAWVDDLRAGLIGDVGDPAGGALGLGNEGPDTLVGTDAANLLDGGPGNDRLEGRGGDDMLVAGPGNDTLLGGDGQDTAVFAGNFAEYRFVHDAATGAITFDHALPADRRKTDGVDETRDIETFAFKDFQLARDVLLSAVKLAAPGQTLLQGGSGTDLLFAAATAITLEGLGGDDVLYGSPQADTLRGGDGNDMLMRSAGSDRIDGGAGIDTWRFGIDNGSGNPSVNLDLQDGTVFIAQDRVTIAGVEHVVIEDARHAWLFGDAADNRLVGAGDRDVIDGRAGNDRLEGGAENDVLIGGPGADSLYGGDGYDVLAAADLALPGVSDHYDGGAGDADTLTYAANLMDWLRGEHIDDFISAKASNGQLTPGPVRIWAGEGRIERLSADGRSVVATDTAVDVERYVGSSGNDELHAGSRVDGVIDGGDGNDVLYADNGHGEVRGGRGNDTVVGGTGGFSAFGDEGDDTLDLSRVDGVRWMVRVTEVSGNRLQVFDAREGSALAEPDTSLKDDWGDALLGGGNVGVFQTYLGGAGDDHFEVQGYDRIAIHGGGGDDFVMGLFGGHGSPSFELLGGDGRDHLVLQDHGVADGGVDGDLIEIDASGSAHVRAAGGAGDDVIRLRGGDTTVEGGDGIDTLAAADRNVKDGFNVDLNTGYLAGYSGTRFITGHVSGIEVVLGAADFSNRLIGSTAGDQLVGGNRGDLLMGGEGADALYGSGGHDELRAEGGDDQLHGGDGNDILDGGDGTDTASWVWFAPGAQPGLLQRTAYATVNADLAAGTAVETGPAGTFRDTLIAIENLTGGNGPDTLRGNDGANLLSGNGGADLLDGRGGNDVLVLDGDDVALGGSGNDRFVIGLGQVQIDGGDGFDTLDFGALTGEVVLDMAGGRYQAQFDVDQPVWADDGSRAPRTVGGQTLTPQQVFEADPRHANSADDASRIVPDDPLLTIRLDPVRQAASGSFTGVEAVTGGNALFIAQLAAPRDGYTLLRQGSDTAVVAGGGNSLRIDAVDRLSFSDQSLAFDFDGAAGQVARLLGAVFGGDAVHNPAWVRIGLDYAAQGLSYEQLGAVALEASGAATPQAMVERMWTAVVGTPPTADQAAPFVAMLQGGTTPGALAVFAADTAENAANIGLTGLMETGLPFSG